MRLTWLAATLAFTLGATSSARSDGTADDDLAFEGAADGIEVRHLIRIAREVTGDAFFFEPAEVADARVFFQGTVVVPRTKFISFFDRCLFESGFIDVERKIGERRVHSLRRRGMQGRSQQAFKSDAPIVAPEDLDSLSDRFMLVTSWLDCRTSQLAREVACPTLCQFFSDSAVEATRNIEGSGIVVMTGQAENVARFSAMARRIDKSVGTKLDSDRAIGIEARLHALEDALAAMQSGRTVNPPAESPPAHHK